MKIKGLLLFLLAFGSVAALKAQKQQSAYEIAKWSGFKKSAVSYTFDDGMNCHFSVVTPLFNRYGYKATLFVMANDKAPVARIKEAFLQGHEIASHTVSHPNLSQLTVMEQKSELEKSAVFIREQLAYSGGLTLAYPYCVTSVDTMVEHTYFAARICSGMIEPPTPKNFMRISSVPCGIGSSVNSIKAFNRIADSTAKKGGWVVYLMHAVDDSTGYGNISSRILEDALKHNKENDSQFWVDTFGNVARYIKERDATSVNEIAVKQRSIDLVLNSALPTNVFNFPLSIRRVLPDGWKSIKVTQAGKNIKYRIHPEGESLFVVFEAKPNGGMVRIVKK